MLCFLYELGFIWAVFYLGHFTAAILTIKILKLRHSEHSEESRY